MKKSNVHKFKRPIYHARKTGSDRALCGRKIQPERIAGTTAQVTCKTCRDILIVSGMESKPKSGPKVVDLIEKGFLSNYRVELTDLDRLIADGLRATENEIAGAIAQAEKALEASIYQREPERTIRELRAAIARLLKLFALLS